VLKILSEDDRLKLFFWQRPVLLLFEPIALRSLRSCSTVTRSRMLELALAAVAEGGQRLSFNRACWEGLI
jgi:hypothetical protein